MERLKETAIDPSWLDHLRVMGLVLCPLYELQVSTNDKVLAKYSCIFYSQGMFVGILFPVDSSQWTLEEIFFFPEHMLCLFYPI